MQNAEAHGARIPLVGLGTSGLPGRECARMVEQAIRIGYRHIDTAQMYGNEREVGEGVRAAGRRGDVFVTTKVMPENLAPNDLARSVKESLARLRLSEIDLLLIHWPNPRVPLGETLGALAKMKTDGYTRHIGVSNFTIALMADAVKLSPEPLVCNQFECHPFIDQSRVIAAARGHGMAVVAYSPIAKGKVASDKVLARIGETYKKTPAQICLRWLVQQGIAVIPRTTRRERLEQNLDVFSFSLTDAEMADIAALGARGQRLTDWSWSPKWDR